eukprot:12792424-Alexandrium_andersonii.AAC.1
MSASLVGSEMCIRDRRATTTKTLRRASCRMASSAAASPLTASSVPSATPVSYTHLTLPTICSV